jgi:L-ascorbate metabolism protein UlaG (beta-lactamase superfamily)
MTKKYHLKQNVQLEPLFNQWFAWSHLVAPATAAMNVADSHLKIMNSYLLSPAVHAAAIKNPAMRGGPFLDVPPERANEIKVLMQKTTKEARQLIDFAEAVRKLSETLSNEATGNSLEPLYERVPDLLKGYVELVYDPTHHPSFRLIEGLLYHSPYYNESLQSIALSLVESDHRAFVFSTPRLEDDRHLHLNIPFSDERIDWLFRMRDVPQTFEASKEILKFENDELFRSLLTEQAPVKPPRYEGDELRIRYFGHACVLLQTKNVSVLTDPVLSYNYDSPVARYTIMDLPETIDYVLITHGHSDHLLFESLLQLRHRIKNIVVPRSGGGSLEDPSLKLALKHTGFRNVVEIDEMETIEIADGSITGVPFLGEHADLNIRAKIAHLVKLKDVSVMFAADSSNLDAKLYDHVRSVAGAVDILFLGMECEGAPLTWVYGSVLLKPVNRKMDQTRRLSGSDFQRGSELLTALECKHVYVYAMGQEPWLSYITSIEYTDQSKPIVESNKLVEFCRNLGLVSERLYGTKDIVFSKRDGIAMAAGQVAFANSAALGAD